MSAIVASAAYLLCALTAGACAFLLIRGYLQTGVRLLLWSGVCFIAFTVENGLLFVDLIVVPQIDLSDPRRVIALIGVLCLLYGLIWDYKRQ